MSDLSAYVDLPPSQEVVRQQRRRELLPYLVFAVCAALLSGYWIGGRGGAGGGATLEPPVLWRGECAPVASDPTLRPTPVPQPLTIYVSGAVREPGLVTVAAGGRVADAIEAAGGAVENADLNAINKAALLFANQHVLVPTLSSPSPAVADLPISGGNGGLLDLNAATAAELETLPHIGATRAQAIVAYREAHGPFAAIEEVQQVSGIGPRIFAEIAPYISVGP